ncbi:MAG: hypothetical protein ACM3JD_08640 [Rudaea sp.]
MRAIVLISADAEWAALQKLLVPSQNCPSPFGEWFTLNLPIAGRDEEVLFFHGGWGKISAAASTQYVIDRWSPSVLVNLGTCGGFDGFVERGSIVLVEKTIVYDIVEQMGDQAEHIAHYSTGIDLSWLATPYPQPVLRTLLVSGDRDLIAQEVQELAARYGAVAGDWESGAIAWVAARNHTRLLILRGVTDLVGASGNEAYGDLSVFQRAAEQVLADLLPHLADWVALALAPRGAG